MQRNQSLQKPNMVQKCTYFPISNICS